jgi:predicted aspartyl protease
MKKFPFKLETDEDLIVIQTWINGHEIRLALDTAATHTVVDLNALLILGYNMSDLFSPVPIETANGVIEVHKIKTIQFASLGIEKRNFEILTYDFISKGILSPHDGVLGLDFFHQTVLTIDFQNQLVWLNN